MTLDSKEEDLIDILKNFSSCAVAFSGGTDSTLLLYYLSKLHIKAKAYTFHSYLYPVSELEEAKSTAVLLNIEQEVIHINPLKDIANIEYNPKNRCYLCKKHMFSMLFQKALNDGFETVIEGSNYDDRGDFRPGFKAVRELGAVSPLDMAALTKIDIRALLQKADLNYEKPSFACYFSRFPYGLKISEEMINKISASEVFIHSLGFNSARVRFHENIARIEASEKHIKDIINNMEIRRKIVSFLQSRGFIFVCIDMQEYKTGSMNRLIRHDIQMF